MTITPSRIRTKPGPDTSLVKPGSGRKVSYEEFFAWAPESRIAEWVDGEIIMPSPPRFGHQDISDFLTAVLRIFTQAFNLGQVISAPFQVKPGPAFPGREPDILFVADPSELDEKTPRLERPPDLAVEIISLESIKRDRDEKYLEYAKAGIREYWLIDGLEQTAEFYRLHDRGFYKTVFAGSEGVYRSQVIAGFALEVSWLWQVPKPRPELVVLEMAGVGYAHEVLAAAARVLPADELLSTLVSLGKSLPSAEREKLREALS